VKCWGRNSEGQLGDGTHTDRPTPVPVVGLTSGVVALSGGYNHTCALTNVGVVKCWGLNALGEVGDGTNVDRLTPVPVVGLSSGVVAITAGGDFSCALTSARGVKCWGHNADGQLGDGTDVNRNTPVPVVGLSSGVGAITTGRHHSCALTSVGAVKCWGYNAYGQLGDGTNVNRNTPVSVVGLSSWVAAVGSGYFHNCALNRAAVVGCWGENESGQIGDRTHRNRWTPVPVASFSGLVRSRAIFATRTLSVGAHTLQAIFPGEALHGPSVGQTTHTVR